MFCTKSGSLSGLIRNLTINNVQHMRYGSYSGREANMLAKLMTGKKKTKSRFYQSNGVGMIRPKEITSNTRNVPSKLTSRRATVLNKMFMSHVTELMASDTMIGDDLKGIGLSIVGVRVCQNYHGLNISWTATATDDFDRIQKKLDSISGKLRHELSQMQLMGNIPHIRFVRDSKLSYFDELDSVISKADYGDDYVPGFRKANIKDDFRLDSEEQVNNSSLPPMKQDVFGLNHSLIMGRVKQSMAKTRQAWKSFETKQLQPSFESKPFTLTTSFDDIRKEAVNDKRNEQVLKDFLQQRKILKKLKRQREREWDEMIEEYQSEESDEHFDDFSYDEDEVEMFSDDLEKI